jgi:hypothetical protein
MLDAFCTSGSSPTESEIDFVLESHGSTFLLRPLTESARIWIDDHIGPGNGYQPQYPTILVEHRYIADIVRGAIADGLAVRG